MDMNDVIDYRESGLYKWSEYVQKADDDVTVDAYLRDVEGIENPEQYDSLGEALSTKYGNGDAEVDASAYETIKVGGRIKSLVKTIPETKVNTSTAKSLRYPLKPGIKSNSDYVVFEFYDYVPPFKRKTKDRVAGTTNQGNEIVAKVFDYNQLNQYKKAREDYPPILLYMPEDISTGFRSNWGGKALSNAARDFLGAAGAEGLDKLNMQDKTYGWTIEMQIRAAQHKLRSVEVPVDYRKRIGVSKVSGTVKGTIMAGYKIIFAILKYKFV